MSVSQSAMPLLIFKTNTDKKKKQNKNQTKLHLLKNYPVWCAYKGKGWILVSLFIQMLDGTIKDGVNFKIKKKNRL